MLIGPSIGFLKWFLLFLNFQVLGNSFLSFFPKTRYNLVWHMVGHKIWAHLIIRIRIIIHHFVGD